MELEGGEDMDAELQQGDFVEVQFDSDADSLAAVSASAGRGSQCRGVVYSYEAGGTDLLLRSRVVWFR